MTTDDIITACIGAAALLLPVAWFVAKRTKNTVDDKAVGVLQLLLGLFRRKP